MRRSPPLIAERVTDDNVEIIADVRCVLSAIGDETRRA